MSLLNSVEAVSRLLWDVSLKATVLLIVAGLAAAALSRSSAAIRHHVWSLTMIGLVLLPALSRWLPAWNLPVLPAAAKVDLQQPVTAMPTETVDLPLDVAATDVPYDAIPWEEPSADSESHAIATLMELPTAPLAITQPIVPIPWLALSLVAVWCIGFVAYCCGIFLGLRHIRRLSQKSTRFMDGQWLVLIDDLRRRLGLRQTVELREYFQPIVPLTWGFFRPRVLLPSQARTWAEPMRRSVLLHELAHVQRADVAYQLLGRLACAMYWFHPLAWLALRQMRQEREQACDDAVLHTGEQASTYAEQLLEVARLYCRPGGLSLAVEMAQGSSLEQRLKALFDAARSHRPLNRRWSWGISCFVLSCVSGVAVVKLVSQEQKPVLVKDEFGRMVQAEGELRHVVQVVDAQKQPVARAKLIQLGFGTARGSGMSWPKDWPSEFVTDDQGQVEVFVPDVSQVAASGEKGISGLYFSIQHPEHPLKRVGLRALNSKVAVVLDDPLQLSIRVVRFGDDSPLVKDVFLQASGWPQERATLKDDLWIADRLNPKDLEAGRFLRVVSVPQDQPACFSELIDLQKQFPNPGQAELNVTVFPGVRVDGVLGDDVPRPITSGRVCAYIADGEQPSGWQWQDVAEVAADGTFSFASLPRDTNLQLIAVCDGWVSESPANKENQAYAQEFGLKIPPRNDADSMIWSRFFRLNDEAVVHVELPMTPTVSCEVTVIDETGKPLMDAEVGFYPNQHLPGIGGNIVGMGHSSADWLRDGFDTTKLFESDWWKATFARFQAKTDKQGRAAIRNLPTGLQNFNVQAEGYEIAPDPHAKPEDWRADSTHTTIQAAHPNRVQVRMRRKPEAKTSANRKSSAAKLIAERNGRLEGDLKWEDRQGREPRAEQEPAADKPIVAIRVEGNKEITADEIMRLIKTRAGETATTISIRADVEALVKTRWFAIVEPSFRESTDGLELVFRVVERSLSAKVKTSIKLGVQSLSDAQEANGSWQGGGKEHDVGVTSLALWALMSAGQPPDQGTVLRGLTYLRALDAGVEPKFHYDMSLMLMAFTAAKDPADRPRITRLAQRLEAGQAQVGGDAMPAGGWSYTGQLNFGGDPSNSQYAVLALCEAAEHGVPVSRDVWTKGREYWERLQNPDGGWGYGQGQSTGSMTVAGIASLSIIQQMLVTDEGVAPDGKAPCCDEPQDNRSIERGSHWLAQHFAVGHNPGHRSWQLYYLSGLERAGRHSGQRYFQARDWYREGAGLLVDGQHAANGQWAGAGQIESHPVIATSFSLLFLSQGMAPVLVNKLKYGPKSPTSPLEIVGQDWNRHPHDIRNLAKALCGTKGWPALMTTQELDLARTAVAGSVDPLLQAPVVYISGKMRPQFTAAEIKLLKDYVQCGGFIFGVPSCESQEFEAGFREMTKQILLPNENELKLLPAEHPVFASEFDLKKLGIELHGAETSGRTAVVLCREDLGCYWQYTSRHAPPNRNPKLAANVLRATKIGANVMSYATSRKFRTKLELPPTLKVPAHHPEDRD